MPLELKARPSADDKVQNDKVTVSFYVSAKNIPEENVQAFKLEMNYCLLQLAKKHAPEDILVQINWY